MPVCYIPESDPRNDAFILAEDGKHFFVLLYLPLFQLCCQSILLVRPADSSVFFPGVYGHIQFGDLYFQTQPGKSFDGIPEVFFGRFVNGPMPLDPDAGDRHACINQLFE